MQTLFWLGVLLIVGYYTGNISQRFKLPKVSGYIFVGVLLSPSFSHILSKSFLVETQTIVHFALAIIAFMIGGSLQYSQTKNLGKTIFSVMLGASQMTFLVVTIGIFFLYPYLNLGTLSFDSWQKSLSFALFLGAIGIATAPAAVLAVIHEYRAKGIFTTTLLGIVATDDALALINFSFIVSVVSFIGGNGSNTMIMSLLQPLGVIFLSLVLGLVTGWIHAKLIEKIADENSLMILTLGMLLLLYSSAEHYHLEALLVCMTYGMMLVNLTKKSQEIFEAIKAHFEEMIFVLFFILSGASVELSLLLSLWPFILLYVFLRMVGKVSGSYLGAKLVNANPIICNNIGFAQMPQASVAIGLALSIYQHPEFSQYGHIILSIVIAATVINEILGPLLLKMTLFKAKEVNG
jgi:Kef-type K+ transport system membrane component KefB